MKIALLTIGAVGSILAGVVLAQQKPVAAMFGDDQKRGETIASSFSTAEIAPTASAKFLHCRSISPRVTGARVRTALIFGRTRPSADQYRTADDGSLARHPNACSLDRVRKQSTVMRDLEEQIAARQKQSPATADGVLNIGWTRSWRCCLVRAARRASGAFPKRCVWSPPDFAKGGANRSSRAVRAGPCSGRDCRACLTALDAGRSVARPATHGRASSGTLAKDAAFEGSACSRNAVS
jgi:hypothetical protein